MHRQNSTQHSSSVLSNMATSAFVPFFACLWCKQGAGTDEHALIEILVTRSNAEIQAMNAAYQAGEPPQSRAAPHSCRR